MADIEMEVDQPTAPAAVTAHEDDLIDYDDELMADDGMDSLQKSDGDAMDLLETGDAVASEVTADILNDTNEYTLNERHQEQLNGTDDSHAPSTEPLVENSLPADDHQAEGVEEHKGVEADVGDDVNEIDFGFEEDQTAGSEQPIDASHGDGAVEAFNTIDEGAEEEHDGEHSTEEQAATQEGRGNDDSAAEAIDHDTYIGNENAEASEPHAGPEDEITWEEGEKDGEDQQVVDETGGDVTAETVPTVQEGTEAEEANDLSGEAAVEQNDSSVAQQSYDTEEPGFPAITVQYKGEEFPFFSLSSEGFFTDASVLDDSIETVLAGFREELVNEIATEEELVFQVDELGLEYAESYPHDSLSHITLRQILEIFDLLVKNQDPDSSRTLYTYLFTKPSTSKRFESLVESAAAGKGLEDVIFHFESPMPHGTNLGDAATGAESFDGIDDYESAEDNAAHEDGQDEREDDHEQDFDEALNAAEEQLGVDEEDGEEVEEAHDQVHEGEEHLDPATEDWEGPSAEAEANAVEDISHTALHVEDDVTAGHSDFDLGDELTNGQTLQQDADENAADEDATNTTASEAHNLDNSAREAPDADPTEISEDQIYQADGAEGDDFAEIDWREEPAEDETVSNTPQSASKRARPDDELDLADEQDAKRQRS